MWCVPWVYVSFCGEAWSILGRMREAREEVCEEAEVVHSARIVVLCAMQALRGGWLDSTTCRVWQFRLNSQREGLAREAVSLRWKTTPCWAGYCDTVVLERVCWDELCVRGMGIGLAA